MVSTRTLTGARITHGDYEVLTRTLRGPFEKTTKAVWVSEEHPMGHKDLLMALLAPSKRFIATVQCPYK